MNAELKAKGVVQGQTGDSKQKKPTTIEHESKVTDFADKTSLLCYDKPALLTSGFSNL